MRHLMHTPAIDEECGLSDCRSLDADPGIRRRGTRLLRKTLKTVAFTLGCVLASGVLLPLFIMAGSFVLVGYSAVTKLRDQLLGRSPLPAGQPSTRQLANQICGDRGALQ